MPSGTVATIDDATFTALLQRATPQLRSFVRRLCGAARLADADDVVQEALARAWRHRGSFDPGLDRQLDKQPDRLDGLRGPQQHRPMVGPHLGSAWLQRVAFRVFCDLRNRDRKQPAAVTELHREPAPVRPCTTELRDEVEHKLAGLPEVERTLLLGFHRDGLSLRELAARQGLPINTVKSHLHRARQRLQAPRQSQMPHGQPQVRLPGPDLPTGDRP